jgi:hypothetical protein
MASVDLSEALIRACTGPETATTAKPTMAAATVKFPADFRMSWTPSRESNA